MYSRQVYNSNGGLASSTWIKLDGYSYKQALSRYVQVYFPSVIENAVVYIKSTNSCVQKYLPM